MSKPVWLTLAIACFLLAGFIIFLTIGHPDVVMRGVAIAGVLTLLGGYPLARAMEWIGAPQSKTDDDW